LASPHLGKRSKEERIAMVYLHWDKFQAEKQAQQRPQLQMTENGLLAYSGMAEESEALGREAGAADYGAGTADSVDSDDGAVAKDGAAV